MEKQTLAPCPFCGGVGQLEDHRTIWAVRCACGVCMLGDRAPEPEEEMPDDYWEGYKQTAVAAWNRCAVIDANAPAVPDAQAQSCVPAGWEALLKDAYLSGFAAPATYNDKVENDAEEEYARWRAASPQPQPVQPSDCEWTNCPRRVGDVCCNEQAKPEQAAQPNELVRYGGRCEKHLRPKPCPQCLVDHTSQVFAERVISAAAPQPKDSHDRL